MKFEHKGVSLSRKHNRVYKYKSHLTTTVFVELYYRITGTRVAQRQLNFKLNPLR